MPHPKETFVIRADIRITITAPNKETAVGKAIDMINDIPNVEIISDELEDSYEFTKD